MMTLNLTSEPSSLMRKLVGPGRATTYICVSGRDEMSSRTSCSDVERKGLEKTDWLVEEKSLV